MDRGLPRRDLSNILPLVPPDAIPELPPTETVHIDCTPATRVRVQTFACTSAIGPHWEEIKSLVIRAKNILPEMEYFGTQFRDFGET